MNKRCYIAGAGEFCENRLPEDGDYIIAADGGYAMLNKLGITPDLIVGDFDSLGGYPVLLNTLADHPNVLKSPVEKDDTDMMLAVKEGLSRGFKSFTINGGLGGRLDQTLANIQILAYLTEHGALGILLGRECDIIAVMNGTIKFFPEKSQSGTVSVFCHGETAEGVTLNGVKYPLENATLSCKYPIGVSNEFIGENAAISVKKSILIVVYPSDVKINDK